MGCPSSTLRATRAQSRESVQAVTLLSRVAESVETTHFLARRTQSRDLVYSVQGLDANCGPAKSAGSEEVDAEQPLLSDIASDALKDAPEEDGPEVDSEAEMMEMKVPIEEKFMLQLLRSCEWKYCPWMGALKEVFMRLKPVLILMGIQGMVFRALDTGLDFRTAVHFYEEGKVEWALLSLTFTLVSPIIQCCFVFRKTKQFKLSLPFLVPGSMQHLRREWRQVQLVRALPQAALFQNMHIHAGASYLNEVLAGIECLCESLPQACIQGYAYHVSGNADVLNYASLSFSLIGVIVCAVSGARAVSRSTQTFGTAGNFIIGWSAASAAGDTMAMHDMHLSNKAVQALASFVRADEFIDDCDLSQTNCTDSDISVLTEACNGFVVVNLSACKNITDAGVTKLAENCRDIKCVRLSGCVKITDAGVTKLAENCKDIKHVFLSGCEQITDEGVTKLAENCKAIMAVYLRGCSKITDECVKKLAENCKDINKVILSYCKKITDEGVTKLAENCRNIHEVDLMGCEQITDEGVTKLAENCKDIKEVWLNDCSQITDEGVKKLAENCKDMKEVDFTGCSKITDEGVKKLAENCKDINEVDFTGCEQITDEAVTKLAENCKDITRVCLSGCEKITDECVKKLAENCKDIKEVHLRGCSNITDEGVTKLAENCKDINVVNLRGCSKITDECVKKLAENCKDINVVILSGCSKVTDEGVTKLAENCEDIKVVDLIGCEQITNEGVTKLAEKCKRPTVLR